MNGIREWFNERIGGALPEETTKAVVAYYWDGGVPIPHRIRNLSATGANILTPEKWYLGTVIQLTLQQGEQENSPREASVSVRSRVIAHEADGVRVQFLFLTHQERHTLGAFLHHIRTAGSSVITQRRTASNGGQSLIEFALILPLIVLLVVNVVNFGSFLYTWIEVSNAARAGAQYMVLSGASLNHPTQATSALITKLVRDDLGSLVNGSGATVRVCTNNNGTFDLTSGQVDASGNPVACASGNTDGFSDPEPGSYVLATVDVSYTWQPLIPLWDFPRLGIHATLPGNLTIHRTGVMRMIQ
jgi:Flp pilus assembly protein TadG